MCADDYEREVAFLREKKEQVLSMADSALGRKGMESGMSFCGAGGECVGWRVG